MTTKITEQNISNLANAGVQWQSVFTGDGSTGLTAVAGRGYFIDTTSGTVEVTLPASPNLGDVVVFKDYARTWNSNAITISSALFDGVTKTNIFNTQGLTVRLVYTGNTKGWSLENEDTTTDLSAQFTSATGGTVTESGDYKIHTFTGDGCFVVSAVGNGPTIPLGGPNTVSYLVVAGGGAGADGGGSGGGGGGAGGFREGRDIGPSYTASPIVSPTGLTISATSFPITVGAGGSAGGPISCRTGSNSIFSTITSTGGGGGGSFSAGANGGAGGGGGGGYLPGQSPDAGGTGNTPPVSPSQGSPGGTSHTDGSNIARNGGGGGGATSAGGNAPSGTMPAPCTTANAGGNAALTSITGSPNYYSGGGGGAKGAGGPGSPSGGNGVGGRGSAGQPIQGITPMVTATAGTANRGGGGGGVIQNSPSYNFPSTITGGSGIVVIRYKFQ